MERLISTDALLKRIDCYPPYIRYVVIKELRYVPTVKAENVIKCIDCKYYDAENHNCLDEMGYARIWNEDDYCSFGERRDDGKNG